MPVLPLARRCQRRNPSLVRRLSPQPPYPVLSVSFALPLPAAHIRPVIASLLSVMHVSAYDFPMDAITFSTARATLAKTMDRVCEDHNPMVITRHGRTSVVMLSLEDYQALEQTADLLRSPANARRLLDAGQPLSAGGVGERDPIQPVP